MSFPNRRPKVHEFTTDELIFLAKEVRKRKKILFGQITMSLTVNDKRKAWKDISVDTLRCGWPKRHPDDIRERWQDLQEETEIKLDEVKHFPDRKKWDVRWTAVDEAVIKVLGKKSPFQSSRQTLSVNASGKDRGSSQSINSLCSN